MGMTNLMIKNLYFFLISEYLSVKWRLALFFILYYDQQKHNYFTYYHAPTCFDVKMLRCFK